MVKRTLWSNQKKCHYPMVLKASTGLNVSNSQIEQPGTSPMTFCFSIAPSVRSKRTPMVTRGLERWPLRTARMICWSTWQGGQKLPVSVKPHREKHFETYPAWSWLRCFMGSSSCLLPGDSFHISIFISCSKPIYDQWITQGKRVYLEVVRRTFNYLTVPITLHIWDYTEIVYVTCI